MIFIWKQSGTSHGKSACDGIGGTVKRPATKASLKRPAQNQILTPLDMFSYCESDGTRTNARASHTKLRTRKCPNFPKLAYAFAKKYHAK